MNYCITRDRSGKLAALLAAAILSFAASPARSADEAEGAPRGPAVTVLKAADRAGLAANESIAAASSAASFPERSRVMQ